MPIHGASSDTYNIGWLDLASSLVNDNYYLLPAFLLLLYYYYIFIIILLVQQYLHCVFMIFQTFL